MTDPRTSQWSTPSAGPAHQDLLRLAEECQFTALACAADCLGDPDRAVCADRCRDTADVCEVALRMVGRERTDPAVVVAVLRLVVDVCRTCLTECNLHAEHHPSCRECAAVCERTATAAAFLIETLNPQAAS
jgi:hypothetical protein